MNWQQSLAWLETLGRFGSRPGLDRINQVLDKLGRPEQGLNIVHVAGTNGKGSVCSLISSVLTAAKYRTGLYTSPHLVRYNERFKIDGQDAPEEELSYYFTMVRKVMDELSIESEFVLTEFEVLTVVAFLYFKAYNVDYLLLEVGMGGRLDATNVVQPVLSIVTKISLDHTAVLGDTVAVIAKEKAGIIKSGVQVVVSNQEPDAFSVIEAVAADKNAYLHDASKKVSVCLRSHSLNGQLFDLNTVDRHLPCVDIKLLGTHQLDNVRTAVCALDVLSTQGARIGSADIRQGLAEAIWPARFELIKEKPVVIIDGAHNVDGAKALMSAVKEYLPDHPIVLVIGVLADKDINTILGHLIPLATDVIVTKPDSPRAKDPYMLAEKIDAFGLRANVVVDIKEAVDEALDLVSFEGAVLICGSLYLAGAARDHLLSG